jgi:hypothetical protein
MMQGRIEQAQMSKSGKTLRIKVGDNWYSTNNFALESAVGRTVQFEVGTSEYMGNTIYWANDAELVIDHGAPAPSNPAAAANIPAPRPQPQSQTPSGSDLTARDFMPFTSNQVAHAIAAGLITKPEDIATWTKAAFHAIKNTVDPKAGPVPDVAPEFDDDIPF